MFCPSCSGQIEADTRYAHLVVCPFCSSAIIVDEKAARVAGKMAVLAQTPSPFFVGGTGVVEGRRFAILGRVRYGYANGYWDEWYLRFDDGSTAWISEDENNFSFEVLVENADLATEYAQVSPGDELTIGNTTYYVDEKDVAECEGGEGQLPFAVLSGQKVPYLDLSADQAFATVELETDGGARVFQGRRLDISEVVMDQTAEEAGAYTQAALKAERAAAEGKRERVVRREDRAADLKCRGCGGPLPAPQSGAESIACAYCGVVLDLSLRRVTCVECGVAVPLQGGLSARSVVCPKCHTLLDVSKNKPSALHNLANLRRPDLPVTIGQAVTFEGVSYLVTGHVHYVERDKWGVYPSDEFLLYSESAGYRWLIIENGHFSLGQELDDRPSQLNPRSVTPNNVFYFRDRKWTIIESAVMKVEFVEGELPWVAEVGDKVSYMDAACPPDLLSAEWTKSEMEWYMARYLSPEEAAAALGLDRGKLPSPKGVAPHQPYPNAENRRATARIGLLFSLLFVAFAVVSCFRTGRTAAEFVLQPSEYTQEYVTEPFEIRGSNSLCSVRVEADVSNAWMYLDLAVVNDKEEAIVDFSSEVSYYSGSDWSEGSRSDTTGFKLDQRGEYRLLVLGQAGTGEQADAAPATAVKLTVYEGASLMRYYIIGAVLCGAVWLFERMRAFKFATDRLGDADDDDDDDDDDD